MAKEQKTDNNSSPPARMGITGTVILGVSLIAAAFLLGYLSYALWAPSEEAEGLKLVLFGSSTTISAEAQLMLLVLVVGLIGSYINTVVSFVSFTGNKRLVKNWLWFYVARPFAGPFVALLFYLVLRGGLLSAGAATDNLNRYGILAFCGLAGLFSSQALEKLRDVFGSNP